MRWFPVIPALLGLLSYTTAQASDAASAQLLSQLQQCIDRQFEQGEVTRRNKSLEINRDCPNLSSWLAHPLLSHFAPPLQNETSLIQLIDIRSGLQSSIRMQKPVPQRDFDFAGLTELVNQTYLKEEEITPEPGLMERFFEWLRELLATEQQETPDWLKNFIDSIDAPETDTLIAILKGIILILVLLALLMIFNELRAANMLAAWRHFKKQRRSRVDALIQQEYGKSEVSELGQLSDKQFASKILYIALLNLMQQRLLPEKFSLTNRELLHSTQSVPELKQLIDYTEAGIYGDRAYSAQQRQQMLTLLQQLTSLRMASP